MSTEQEIDDKTLEYASEWRSLNDFINRYSSSASMTDITLDDLYIMLRNPYTNIEKIQKTARFMTNRYGIIRDVIEAFKYLPTLNFHLIWSNYDNPKKIEKYEKKVYELISNLDLIKVVRDGLGEQAEVGQVIAVNRRGKYIQFLDIDLVRINKQKNGRWIVEVDLSKVIANNLTELKALVNSLPDEVTIKKLTSYRKNPSDETRYVEISNAYVLPIRGNRNFPYGFPLTFASWTSFLHKTMIEQLEKSTVDKLIKTILVMVAKSIGENNKEYKPPKGELVQKYFKDLTNLIQKKDRGQLGGVNDAGTGVVVLPEFLGLEEIKVNSNLPTRDLYEKLDRDIFASIGVSSALIYGGGQESNYGSANMNSEKFFKYIFGALEMWESMINDIIKSVLPSDLDCKLYFDKTTITNKEDDITAKKEFYLQTGIWIPYAEAVLGVPYTYALSMKQYQDKVLKLDDLIHPPINAYTQTDNGNGDKPTKNIKDKTENTIKSDDNGSNNIPSPSD